MTTLRMKIVFWVTLICMSGDALYVSAAESSNLLMFLPSILSANVAPKTCEDNWTIIGDIPEYSFSSEPLIDENTAFTMNVDPADQLMLTAVTTNGWTIEYFATKDEMGASVFLTGIHMMENATGRYCDMKFDGKNRPVSIEQQDGKPVLLNWENCTIYGEKEWTVVGELPDFSSISSPIINDQTEVLTNTNPSDPLWLTVTTSDGWIVKYFATKNFDGSPMNITFIHAANSSTGDIVMAEIDGYGQPSRISKQDGKIIALDWLSYSVDVMNGSLEQPESGLVAISKIAKNRSESDKISNCTHTEFLFYSCGLFAFIAAIPDIGPPTAAVLTTKCMVITSNLGLVACNPDMSVPIFVCKSIFKIIGSAYAGVALLAVAGGPIGWIGGIAAATTAGVAFTYGDKACDTGSGNSSGDPHLRTFDGLGYDFQAVGEFVYIQSTEDPTEMTVQIRQEPSGDSKHVAWNTAVVMSVGGDIVEINGRNTPPVSINHTPRPMANNEIIQLQNGCKIYAESQSKYLVIWKDNTMVKVGFHGIYFAVTTSLPDSRKGLVKGLLGNSDGDKANDLQTRDGSTIFDITTKLTKDELYNQFGNSWRITQEESLFTYAEGEDTAAYTDLNFPYELVKASDLSETARANAEQICRDAGIIDPILLEDCILDVGMTGDATFADNMTDLMPPEQSITVTDGWLLYGNAQKTEGDEIIRITPDESWQTGMALREGALNLDGSFEKTFTVYMGDNDNGADGMIFIMLPELPPDGTSLSKGGDLGFDSACNEKPCFGVEIDTYRNPSDPSQDHIALIRNGQVNHNSTENEALPPVSLSFNIEDDATHSLTVGWNKDTQTFSVSLDGTTVITHEGLDLKTLLGTSTASYGFVGATGTMTSEQYFYPVISF